MKNKFPDINDIPLRMEIQPYMFELPARVDCNASHKIKYIREIIRHVKFHYINVSTMIFPANNCNIESYVFPLIIVPNYTQVHTTCIFSKYHSWIYIVVFDNFIKLLITKLEYM